MPSFLRKYRAHANAAWRIIMAMVLALGPLALGPLAQPAHAQMVEYYLSEWVQGTVNATAYGWNTTGAVSGTVNVYNNAQLVGVVIEVLSSSGGYAPTARVGLVDSELWNDRSGGPQDYYPNPVSELCTDFDAGGTACAEVGYAYSLVAGTTRTVDLTPGTYQGSVGIDSWELAATYTLRWALILYGFSAPPTATPIPITNACIPANLVPTATPYPVITPTPFGTRTPTATPPGGTPAPTATPIPQQFLSRANFQTSLDPWTTNGGVGWGSAPGADLQAGVAVLPFTAGSTITQTGSTQLTAPNDALILEHLGLPAPWRIAGDIRLSDGVPAGTHPYLQVFAWVDGGLGTGSWELVSNVQVNQAWSTWTALSTISQTRAIALRAVLGLSSITNPLGFIPQDYPDRSIWVDNLRVVAGRDYNSPFVIGLPVCAGSGGAFGPGTQYKSCAVTRQEVNVFTCETPSDLLNIGGWIGWLWCSLWKYFQWNDANTDQITALIERNAHHQPFAAASDLISSIYLIADAARAFAAMPAVADVGQPDFSNMLNARPLDQPLQLPMPALEDTGDDPMAVTRAACPQALLDISATLAPGACYAAYRIKQLGALTVIQWLFNIACWLWLGRWFYLLFANRTEL